MSAVTQQERWAFWGQADAPLRPSAERVLAVSTKRSPKWKFRLAPDLIVEMQPKAGAAFRADKPKTTENLVPIWWFAGRVLSGDGVDARAFIDTAASKGFWRLNFHISDWKFDRKGVRCPRGIRFEGFDPFVALPERVTAAFEAGFFEKLEPAKMLGSNCLWCGKGLTDPVSRARLIGPECWGSSSDNLPLVYKLQPEGAAA